MTQTEFDGWVATLLDGGPSIFMDSLAVLQSTYPNGAAGVALVRETDPAKLYAWNNGQWEFITTYVPGEVENGSITRDKLALEAVSPAQTTFAKKGKNLWDGKFIRGWSIVGSVSQDTGEYASRPGTVSVLIPIARNTTYTFSRSPDTNRFLVGLSKGKPKNSGYIKYLLQVFGTGALSYTFESDDYDYLVVVLSNAEESKTPSYVQLEVGDEATEYESPSKVVLDLKDESLDGSSLINGSISALKTDFIDINPDNLFDGNFYTIIPSIGGNHESMIPSNLESLSGCVEVEEGETYTINKIVSTTRFNVATYDRDPRTYLGDSALSYIKVDNLSATELTLQAPAGANYMLINVTNNLAEKPMHMTVTKTNLAQHPYSINPNLIKIHQTNSDRFTQKNIGLIADVKYIKNATPDYDLSDISSPNPLDATYGLWDTLLGDGVTKKLLWNENSKNIPTYRYRLEAPKPRGVDAENITNINILVIGNIHGHETYATLTIINFFKDMVTKWHQDEILEMLKYNINFDVIPAYSAWGLKYLSRTNGNGVDLNSNLSENWSLRDELGSAYYSGPHAMSEVESQAFETYLNSLPYEYDFAVDMHHSSSYEHNGGGDPDNGFVAYTRSFNEDINRILYGVASQVNGYLHKEYPSLFEKNPSVISLSDHEGTGRMFRYLESKRIPGTLLEIAFPGSVINAETTIKIGQTLFGNILLGAVRNIDRIRMIE